MICSFQRTAGLVGGLSWSPAEGVERDAAQPGRGAGAGAPRASPGTAGRAAWQHLSFLHIWSKKVQETEVPFARRWSESVSQLGVKGDLQSSLLSNESERLLLVGDEYNEVERRQIFKRVN